MTQRGTNGSEEKQPTQQYKTKVCKAISTKNGHSFWKNLTNNVNTMTANLTEQVHAITEVTALRLEVIYQKITADVQGENLQFKHTNNTHPKWPVWQVKPVQKANLVANLNVNTMQPPVQIVTSDCCGQWRSLDQNDNGRQGRDFGASTQWSTNLEPLQLKWHVKPELNASLEAKLKRRGCQHMEGSHWWSTCYCWSNIHRLGSFVKENCGRCARGNLGVKEHYQYHGGSIEQLFLVAGEVEWWVSAAFGRRPETLGELWKPLHTRRVLSLLLDRGVLVVDDNQVARLGNGPTDCGQRPTRF